jgi:hypothetical protein
MTDSSTKLNTCFKLWDHMSGHLRMRDRTVKILQYGCQMLVGYYGSKMTDALREGLTLTRGLASNARKTYWMLKPIYHIYDFQRMMNIPFKEQDTLFHWDLFEAFMWMLYYIFENLIFLSRLKIKYFYEENFDYGCNLSWAIGDATFMITSTYRLLNTLNEYRKLKPSVSVSDAPPCQCNKHILKVESSESLDLRRRALELDITDLSLGFIIVRFPSYDIILIIINIINAYNSCRHLLS